MGISRDLVVPDLRSASPSPLHRSGRLEPQLPGKTPTHKTTEGYRLGTTVSSFSMLVATGLAVRVSPRRVARSEEHTSELQSQSNLVCRLLLEKKKKQE